MANSSQTYNLPKVFIIDAKPFIALDSPLDEEDSYFDDEDEDKDKEENEKPTTQVFVKVEAGPLVSTLTVDLKQVTKKVLETYAECYGAFKPGNLNFEFADQAGDVWVARCPIQKKHYYDLVFEGVPLHFWESASDALKQEFEEGKFLCLEPWSCGHLEDEYRCGIVSIDNQEYDLSTRDFYATQEIAWSDTRKIFIIKQIGWNTDEMEELEPIYFELEADELFPLQGCCPGTTFHRLSGRQGTAQSNFSVKEKS